MRAGMGEIAWRPPPDALERSRIVLVPRDALREIMEQDAVFVRAVSVVLAGEVRRLIRACEDMTLRTPIERVARYIVLRAGQGGVAELDETQAEIAGELGTVREVVGRALREIEARGLVARTGHLVRVLRPVELAALGKR